MLPESLRARLALWFGGVLLAVLVGFSAVVFVVAVQEPDHDDPREADEAREAGERLIFALLATLPVALAAGVGGALAITRRGLRPLDDVVAVAERLAVDRLDLRVALAENAPAEVQRLGTTLNTMVARLERSVSGLQRFTADAAHELRTPLARVILELETTLRHPRDEATLRTAIEDALDETRALGRLADALLALSRADAGELAVVRVDVDLAAVVSGASDAWEETAAARGQQLVIDVAADASAVVGDTLWLTRALSNLVENACKFTPARGRVAVVARRVGDCIVVAVEDDGPGIATAERERVFERFFRSTQVRGSVPGFGLGLPLARDIARALGGDVVVDAAHVGGARLLLTLQAR